jgi:hypothetical protein
MCSVCMRHPVIVHVCGTNSLGDRREDAMWRTRNTRRAVYCTQSSCMPHPVTHVCGTRSFECDLRECGVAHQVQPAGGMPYPVIRVCRTQSFMYAAPSHVVARRVDAARRTQSDVCTGHTLSHVLCLEAGTNDLVRHTDGFVGRATRHPPASQPHEPVPHVYK